MRQFFKTAPFPLSEAFCEGNQEFLSNHLPGAQQFGSQLKTRNTVPTDALIPCSRSEIASRISLGSRSWVTAHNLHEFNTSLEFLKFPPHCFIFYSKHSKFSFSLSKLRKSYIPHTSRLHYSGAQGDSKKPCAIGSSTFCLGRSHFHQQLRYYAASILDLIRKK